MKRRLPQQKYRSQPLSPIQIKIHFTHFFPSFFYSFNIRPFSQTTGGFGSLQIGHLMGYVQAETSYDWLIWRWVKSKLFFLCSFLGIFSCTVWWFLLHFTWFWELIWWCCPLMSVLSACCNWIPQHICDTCWYLASLMIHVVARWMDTWFQPIKVLDPVVIPARRHPDRVSGRALRWFC